jgi:hypothetical protein
MKINSTLDTMIRKETFDKTLDSIRKEVFDEALADYDFGDEFVGNDSITKDGDIWSCKVYLLDEESEDSLAVSFMVQFVKDMYSIDFISHDCI